MAIYVKTDGKKFYAYRYPNVLLCEVDISKPVYYKIGKTGYNSKYIVFSNEKFEFRELSKTTTTFFFRYKEKNIILARYDTSTALYFPLNNWIEVEDRTGMLPKKQANNTEHIILKFPKFTKIAFIVLSLFALIYIPIILRFCVQMYLLVGIIVVLCLIGYLYCLLWKIEFFDKDDFFIYSSIFAGRKKKVYFTECERFIWSKKHGFFQIKTKNGKKILVLSLVSNYEMFRKKLLQNGVEEEKHQNKG